MKTVTPRMTNLFLQLGLDASEPAIADFIGKHQLPSSKHLVDAPFWNEGQRQFLSEQYKSDGDWAIIIDQLNESLHEDSIKRQTGL
ncbi:DUF2789 domain-containing protein [Kerstersia similis]|uniref:DUF2789 domain-containing protein n=1 Tax=Kerstersia similis TaxID=206505 RepID=UPI0039EFA7DC